MAKILLVEDEQKIAQLLQRQLKTDLHSVTWIADGRAALVELQSERFDLMIFDLMLPGLSGEQLLKQLRAFDIKTPVIALTAKGSLDNIVDGLDHGFDDYLPKPFSYAELSARIRALLRRSTSGEVVLQAGSLQLDPQKKRTTRNGQELKLTNREYQLLEYLLRHKGQFVTQEELLENIWDRNYEGFSNTVVVHIKNLKQKVDKSYDYEPAVLYSERGKGYKIDE